MKFQSRAYAGEFSIENEAGETKTFKIRVLDAPLWAEFQELQMLLTEKREALVKAREKAEDEEQRQKAAAAVANDDIEAAITQLAMITVPELTKADVVGISIGDLIAMLKHASTVGAQGSDKPRSEDERKKPSPEPTKS